MIYLGDDPDVNFMLGDYQVPRMYFGTAPVWPLVSIDDLVASSGEVFQSTITFTDPNTEFTPEEYDLYRDGIKVADDIQSGYVYDSGTEFGFFTFAVRAVYLGQQHRDSNLSTAEIVDGIAPGYIDDFVASDTLLREVTLTWTNDPIGDPTPYYDVYVEDGILATNVASGYTRAVPGGTTEDYYVKAINFKGEMDSNHNSGYGVPGYPPEITNFNATDNIIELVTFTWEESTADPIATFDVYQDGTRIFDNVLSGVSQVRLEGTSDYYVIGTNSIGSDESNHDSGTALTSNTPPIDITNFAASDNQIEQITFTWTNSTGKPPPIQDLYQNGVLFRGAVSSGVVVAMSAITADYFIRAHNSEGTIDSNINSGTALTSNTAPTAITNFVASDDETLQISFTWTNSTGKPTPVQELHKNSAWYMSGVSSPLTVAMDAGTDDYSIFASNSEGSIESNVDSGTAVAANTPPVDITNFVASDNQIEQITFTWTNSTGNPTPVQELHKNSAWYMSGVSSPLIVAMDAGTDDYSIFASNSEGSIESNVDSGTSVTDLSAPGEVNDLEASDDELEQVTITWTLATGNPAPQYDLWMDNNLIFSNILPGVVHAVPGGGTGYYGVYIHNSQGNDWSNNDYGTALSTAEAPGYVDDFRATDNQVGVVYSDWTPTTGSPAPTYDLHKNGSAVLTNISPGVPYNTTGTDLYSVMARNSSGDVRSNSDNGTGVSDGAPPSYINDFYATDDRVGEVAFFWSAATGNPTPTYDVDMDGSPFLTNVSSGYTYSIDAGTHSYSVRAVNSNGNVRSNADDGTSLSSSVSHSWPLTDFNTIISGQAVYINGWVIQDISTLGSSVMSVRYTGPCGDTTVLSAGSTEMVHGTCQGVQITLWASQFEVVQEGFYQIYAGNCNT